MYLVLLSPDKSPDESSPFLMWLKKPFHATLTLFTSRWKLLYKALISFDLERYSTRNTANRKTWLAFLQCFFVSLWFAPHVNCSGNNVNLNISKKQKHPAQKQNDRSTAKVSGIQFMMTNLAIFSSARKFSTKHSIFFEGLRTWVRGTGSKSARKNFAKKIQTPANRISTESLKPVKICFWAVITPEVPSPVLIAKTRPRFPVKMVTKWLCYGTAN